MNDLDLVPFRLLIDRVVGPARHHFRRLFPPIAVPLAVAGLMLALVQTTWIVGAGEDFEEGAMAVIGSGCLLFVVYLAAYSLGFSALLVGSLDAVAGRPVDMRRAWFFALRPPVLATLVIVATASSLAFMMFLLPALYVVPALTFVLPAMVEEGRLGFDAIRRSVELVHWNPTGRWRDSVWLQTLVLLAIGLVVNYALTFTVQLPFVVIQQVLFFRDAAAGELGDPAALMGQTLWLQLPTQVLTACATTASWLYWTCGISLLYREVRRRKEAADLGQAIDQLTGESEPTAATPPVRRTP